MTQPPSIGAQLSHYRILAQLGKGGMGDVYRAEDQRLGREIALKVLPAQVAADPARFERFQREARSIAALSHPNIVTVFSVEEAEGRHFLTMELVEGQVLDEVIPEGGLDLRELLEIAEPLTDALAEAHAKGIVHRDLKPANVMVTAAGQVKVLDFGLATEGESAGARLTREGQILGTPGYMSPEQACGKTVDARSDVFALGVLLFEMATGQLPFTGSSFQEMFSALMSRPVPRLRSLRRELPRDLERAVDRCLAKEPEQRFAAADDLLDQLHRIREDWIEGSGVRRWVRRVLQRERSTAAPGQARANRSGQTTEVSERLSPTKARENRARPRGP